MLPQEWQEQLLSILFCCAHVFVLHCTALINLHCTEESQPNNANPVFLSVSEIWLSGPALSGAVGKMLMVLQFLTTKTLKSHLFKLLHFYFSMGVPGLPWPLWLCTVQCSVAHFAAAFSSKYKLTWSVQYICHVPVKEQYPQCFLADPGKARGCSTNTFVIN